MRQQATSQLLAVSHCFPDQVVDSDSLMEDIKLEQRFGINPRYLRTLTGIEERRWASDSTMPSALAIEASIKAIAQGGVDPGKIDCVLYCSIERDWQEPATAHRVQYEIGAKNATCFDITNACHGFMNGLAVADSFIAHGTAELCLICTGEVGSRVARGVIQKINQQIKDKEELRHVIGALTLGDAGAAVLMSRAASGTGFKRFKFESAGEFAELCHYAKQDDEIVDPFMAMEEICQETLDFHRRTIEETYLALGWEPWQVDSLICHQVGLKPHRQVCRLAQIEPEKAPITVNKYGNLASATIPTVLSLNPPQKGDKVLVLSSGSGMTIGQSALLA